MILSKMIPSTIALERKGSIGILMRSSPILVIYCLFPSRAPINVSNSREFTNPSSLGLDKKGNLTTSLILKDFILKTTVYSDEFSIYGVLHTLLFLKLASEYNLKQCPGAVLPDLPALCLAED